MKTASKVFFLWLPFAATITGVCLLTYATVQQNYRQSLNDPQIQMAEDAARALGGGDVPASVVPRGVPLIDIATSLSPWIAVYDESHVTLESSAVFWGAPPKPPAGVFEAARGNQGKGTSQPEQNRITWQPESGVRSAIVVQHYAGSRPGYVIVGRSMREVEIREQNLATLVGTAWIALLIATFLALSFL